MDNKEVQETEVVAEQKQETVVNTGDSSVFGVSVRAWLALLVVSTVCVISVMYAHASIKAGGELLITEPLYTLSGMALGFYFGQRQPARLTP